MPAGSANVLCRASVTVSIVARKLACTRSKMIPYLASIAGISRIARITVLVVTNKLALAINQFVSVLA